MIRPCFTILGITCFLFVSTITGAQDRGKPGPQKRVLLRVLSYNIHHAEGVDRKLDVARIARVIRSVKPDLVALQEVDRKASRTGSVDQPAELARLTKMHIQFGPNIELQGGHYGNALLSRFPLSRSQNHLLPNKGKSEQRGVLETEIKLPGTKQSLLFFATHLDHRGPDAERLASAQQINALVKKHPSQAALLAGDLNDRPSSPTLKRFGSTWSVANDKPLATVPVGKPTRQIDFVLYRPKERWKVIEVKVLNEAVASDHRAIFAILELLPEVKR